MSKLIESSTIKFDPVGKRFEVVIIEGDRQGSSAYYPSTVLEADQSKFAGRARIYLDHPSEDDKFNRPERSARDIIGFVENGRYEGKNIVGEASIFSEWQTFVKERAEAGLIGLSIRASGKLSEAGVLETFNEIHSVDLVTTAGAGGKFTTVLESAIETSALTPVAESTKEEDHMELPKELLAALDKLVEVSTASATSVAKLVERADAEDVAKAEAIALAEAEKAPKAPTFAEIDKALTEAELPAAARATVLAAVEAGADLTEAVAAKKAEVEALLTEAGKFSGHASGDGVVSLSESVSVATAGLYS